MEKTTFRMPFTTTLRGDRLFFLTTEEKKRRGNNIKIPERRLVSDPHIDLSKISQNEF